MGRVATVAAEPSALVGRRLDRMLDRLEPYRESGRLLDVGCGRGTVALAARAAGWDVYATEISATCVAELRPLFGERLHEGPLLEVPFARASFDVVLMIEVLEHLDDPAAYLAASRALLRPGGILLVTTPNFRGFSGRLRGPSWRVVADEHLTYFDEASLRRALRAAGFARIRMSTGGLDVPRVVDWVRSLGAASRGGRKSGESTGAAVTPRESAPALADAVIEATNVILRTTHLGDGIRALAERPRGTS